MNRNVVVYCTLMLLIVMGAFASMALNNYGVLIMSYASLGFSIMFFVDLIALARRTDLTAPDKRIRGIELAALVSLCLLFALRGLKIDVPFKTILIPSLLVILILVHLSDFYRTWSMLTNAPSKIKVGVISYFGALLLLIVAYYLFGIYPIPAFAVAMICFFLITMFFLLSGKKNAVIVEGEKTNPFHIVSGFKTKSAILMIGLSVVVIYNALNTLDVLPPLYFGSMPNGYSKVISLAKNANDSTRATDPESFEDAYKKFVRNK